jgi:hypothetical protein
MFKSRLISAFLQIFLFGFPCIDLAWAVSGNGAPNTKAASAQSSNMSATRAKKSASLAKPKLAPQSPSSSKSLKVAKGTKKIAPVAKPGLASKMSAPNRKKAKRVGQAKMTTQSPKVSRSVVTQKNQALAKTTSEDEAKGKKTRPKNAKKSPKEKKPKTDDAAEQNPGSLPADQMTPGEESNETDWLTIVGGVSVLALGIGGMFWYRLKKNSPRIDSSVDLQSDTLGVSNFVSNVTAFDFDAATDAGAKPERRGKEPSKKKGRERISDQLSLTQADHRMIEDTPFASTESNQRLQSNPPASRAPSQIVVPKKAKPPAA